MRKKWLRENKYNVALKFTAFLINPLLAFMLSIIRLKTKSSFIILFLVFISFGMSLTVSSVRTDVNNFDAIAYRNDFEAYRNVTVDIYKSDLIDYLSFEALRQEVKFLPQYQWNYFQRSDARHDIRSFFPHQLKVLVMEGCAYNAVFGLIFPYYTYELVHDGGILAFQIHVESLIGACLERLGERTELHPLASEWECFSSVFCERITGIVA